MTTITNDRAARFAAAAPRDAEIALLQGLWIEQQRWAAARADSIDKEGMAYLRSHLATPIALERQLRVLDWLAPHVRGRVLEWGCRHGLDSCIHRQRLGSLVELHGCDVCNGDDYAPFHEFSGMRYQRLDHPWRLDYPDAAFDVVTSNGVLEHVPDDRASLGELARVLRPGGTLLIACLPNRFSYTEALQRRRGVTAHDRLYTLGATKRLLRERGFETRSARRFLMLPTMLHGFPDAVRERYQHAERWVWRGNDLLERAWPLNYFASNLMVVARKPD